MVEWERFVTCANFTHVLSVLVLTFVLNGFGCALPAATVVLRVSFSSEMLFQESEQVST